MNTMHDIVRQYSTTYYAVMMAIRATGLTGRQPKNGERVWTNEEVRKIAAMLPRAK